MYSYLHGADDCGSRPDRHSLYRIHVLWFALPSPPSPQNQDGKVRGAPRNEQCLLSYIN